MDYKARFYSPYLMRFIQPDTLIPNPASSQSWNRFAYVGNNPIRFNDPTGHNADCGVGTLGCKAGKYTAPIDQKDSLNRVLSSYGITTDGFTRQENYAILRAAKEVGDKFSEKRERGESSAEAFNNVYEGVSFKKELSAGICGDPTKPVDSGGCTDGPHNIRFWSMAGHGDIYGNELTRNIYNVVHELGHAYDKGHNNPSFAIPTTFAEERDLYLRPNGIDNHPGPGQFTQHNSYLNLQQNRTTTPFETYGDIFIAWVFDKWNTNPDNAVNVSLAQGYMP